MAKRTITPETRAKWRAAALKNQPWRHSTGPKTAEGKLTSVRNGKLRQKNPLSYRELIAFARKIREEVRAAAAHLKEAEKQLRKRAADERRASTTGTETVGRETERNARSISTAEDLR